MSEVAENFKKIVISDFDYFKKWYDFNFNVEKYLTDRSWEKIFRVYQKDVFEILSKSKSSKSEVRKNLLKILDLKETVDYDIDSKQVRLVTSSKDVLEKAMLIAGAIFYHKEIIMIISKKELDIVIQFIGQNVYSFIIKRGMILWKMVPEIKFTVKSVPITEKIRCAGKEILCKALFGLPEEVKKRLELMFEEKFDIPTKCDEILSKRCFDLIKFSVEKAKSV